MTNIYCESQAFCSRCRTNPSWQHINGLPDVCPRGLPLVKTKCTGCKHFNVVCQIKFPQSKGACTDKLNSMIKGFIAWLETGKCPLNLW